MLLGNSLLTRADALLRKRTWGKRTGGKWIAFLSTLHLSNEVSCEPSTVHEANYSECASETRALIKYSLVYALSIICAKALIIEGLERTWNKGFSCAVCSRSCHVLVSNEALTRCVIALMHVALEWIRNEHSVSLNKKNGNINAWLRQTNSNVEGSLEEIQETVD